VIQDLYKLEEHLRIARVHLDEANEMFDRLMDFVTEEACEQLELEKY
jgi:Tfp pilus assembly ATPase PilU